MEIFTEFQLFSFLPALAIGGLIWYERLRRHAGQKRTLYLGFSLTAVFLAGAVQTSGWVFRASVPTLWPLVFVLSGLLYFSALILLEYAVHVKRIQESFLMKDFRKRLRLVGAALALAGVMAVLGLAYTEHRRWLVAGFSGFLIVADLLTALKLFNLQEGVIRKRSYPFVVHMAVTVTVLAAVFLSPGSVSDPDFVLPLGWFILLNLVYVVRLIEEFFFWSLYQLRSDRNRIEQRHHLQHLLIRRVIGSVEDDRTIVRDLMEAALEKVRSRLVVEEYQITGMVAYRAQGSVLRVWEPGDMIGSCPTLGGQILQKDYDLSELCDRTAGACHDFDAELIRKAVVRGRMVVESELPVGLKGLQRLVVVVPVFDSERLMGVLIAFKQAFDRLYPAEKDVLEELAEHLASVWVLIDGKDVQRESRRLQASPMAFPSPSTSPPAGR